MKRKQWTKEEFQEACREHMECDPYLLQKQERRRQWLRKKRNKRSRHAKSKLQ